MDSGLILTVINSNKIKNWLLPLHTPTIMGPGKVKDLHIHSLAALRHCAFSKPPRLGAEQLIAWQPACMLFLFPCGSSTSKAILASERRRNAGRAGRKCDRQQAHRIPSDPIDSQHCSGADPGRCSFENVFTLTHRIHVWYIC